MIIRFWGWSHPINGEPSSWDIVENFDDEEAAAEAIQNYIADHDNPDGAAYYSVLALCSSISINHDRNCRQ